MHSFGESPNVVVESRLSQILEDKVHPKYFLSAKACRGVLRRAERRGKELPTELKQALEEQAEWLESHLDFNPEYGEINDETSNTPPPNDRTNSGNAGRGNRQADGHNAGQAAGEFRGAIGFDPSADRDVGQNVYSECESTVHNGTCPGHKCGVVLPLPTVAAFKRLQGSKAYGIGYEEETAPTLVSNAEQPSIVEINKDDKADI